MRIRWKLLILLLAISLPPLVVVVRFASHSTYRLGKELGGRARRVLTERTAAQLRLLVDDQAALVGREGQIISLSVQLQARAVEQTLAARPPDVEHVYFSEDFDQPAQAPPDLTVSPQHFRLDKDGRLNPIPISESQQVFKLAPGIDRGAVMDDIRRLASITPTYSQARKYHTDLFYWQYTSLESGVHSCYPGHGGYPADYDARTRPWYRDAQRVNKLMWTPPYPEVSTGQMTITVAMPVCRPDSTTAGYTAIDIAVSDIMRLGRSPAMAGLDAQAKVIALRPRSAHQDPFAADTELGNLGPDDIDLLVLAQSSYEGVHERSDAGYKMEWLESDHAEQFRLMKQDMLNGQPGVREMPYQGRAALWAYGVAWKTKSKGYLVVIVPQEKIAAEAVNVEDTIAALTKQHLVTTGIAFLVVTVVVAVVALLGSRAVTRPVRQLAEASHRIAAGDFQARANITTRDELGELGQAFNSMIPQLEDRLRLRQSLSLAMEVQQSLLPAGPPTIAGLDIAGKSIYCDQTGGDYYDFLDLSQLGPDHLGVAVGDVTGHGVAAALLMTTARALLRSRAWQPGSLAEIMEAINRRLSEDTPVGRFMTLFYLVVAGRDKKVRWISAGHDPAITYHRPSDTFGELAGHDIPLGIEAGWQFHEEAERALRSDEVLVIGTDGIWECQNAQGDMFGKDALREVIRQHAHQSAAEISQAITDVLHTFRDPRPQLDDVTLVVIKVQ